MDFDPDQESREVDLIKKVHYCHENVMECQEDYLMGFNYDLLMENGTDLKADLDRLWP